EIRANYTELSPVVTGAPEVVKRLSQSFRLGLIANQGRECRHWLAELGLLRHFSVAILGDEVGLAKAEVRLVQRALESAGRPGAECVMIGDRLDNDIAPAAALGMTTVWVRWLRRAAKGWQPTDVDAIAFRESLERTPQTAEVSADLVIDEIRELNPSLLAPSS